MLVHQVLKVPRQKWGDVKFIFHTQKEHKLGCSCPHWGHFKKCINQGNTKSHSSFYTKEGSDKCFIKVLICVQKSTSSFLMSTSTTCLWYRISLSAVMASISGARMRVGPKTMARFSAFIRLNFSFCVTLQLRQFCKETERLWRGVLTSPHQCCNLIWLPKFMQLLDYYAYQRDHFALLLD